MTQLVCRQNGNLSLSANIRRHRIVPTHAEDLRVNAVDARMRSYVLMCSLVIVAGMVMATGTGATVRLRVENHRSCPLSWREHQHAQGYTPGLGCFSET